MSFLITSVYLHPLEGSDDTHAIRHLLRYQPSVCDLRVFLKEHGAAEAEPSPYQEVLKVLGQRHEQRHLETFLEYEDLSNIKNPHEWIERTNAAIGSGAQVVYQSMLKAYVTIGGLECEVVGRPDFLIKEGSLRCPTLLKTSW